MPARRAPARSASTVGGHTRNFSLLLGCECRLRRQQALLWIAARTQLLEYCMDHVRERSTSNRTSVFQSEEEEEEDCGGGTALAL